MRRVNASRPPADAPMPTTVGPRTIGGVVSECVLFRLAALDARLATAGVRFPFATSLPSTTAKLIVFHTVRTRKDGRVRARVHATSCRAKATEWPRCSEALRVAPRDVAAAVAEQARLGNQRREQ